MNVHYELGSSGDILVYNHPDQPSFTLEEVKAQQAAYYASLPPAPAPVENYPAGRVGVTQFGEVTGLGNCPSDEDQSHDERWISREWQHQSDWGNRGCGWH